MMDNIMYPESYEGRADLYHLDKFIDQLETGQEFYSLYFYEDESCFTVSFIDEYGKRKHRSRSKKIPEKHTVEFFRKNILKMQELRKEASQYVSVKKYFSKKYKTFNIYATSFGLSVVVVCRDIANVKRDIDEIVRELNKSKIEFATQLSDAKWVYRFILSKKKENIEKLERMVKTNSPEGHRRR